MKNTIFTIAIVFASLFSMAQNAQVITKAEPVLIGSSLYNNPTMCSLHFIPDHNVYVFSYMHQQYKYTYGYRSFSMDQDALDLLKSCIIMICKSEKNETVSIRFGETEVTLKKIAGCVEFVIFKDNDLTQTTLTKAQLKSTFKINL